VLYSGVPLLGAQDLVKAYGDRELFAGASLTIEPGERVGLVGINGSGKSTLARLLVGLGEPDAGQITRERGMTLGYLAQEPEMDGGATALEVALSGLKAWTDAMVRHQAASAGLEAGTGDVDALVAEQSRAAHAIERLGGWEMRYQAESILGHLGIPAADQVVGTMSGGERRRVAMARLLVARPDLAVLDEPTNHLDVTTVEWLEQHLIERFTGSLLVITHDRYLLDRVVTRIVELDHGALYSFDGGWEAYLTAKAERAAQAERVEANRGNFLRRELAWLRRQPKARTGKQKARIDRANQAIDTDAPAREQVAAIAVGATRSGKTILETQSLSVDVGGMRLVRDLTLVMRKGDRIGIVGPNGAGKTSLVRALLGQLEPAAGTVTRGKNTRIAYLDQGRAGLDPDKSVLENVADNDRHITLGDQTMEARTYLQRFLFSVSDQARAVGTLSGGERARVALARSLRDSANLIVLDEPTNDLDVTTLAALEAALLDSGGSALVITHDRWFLDRVATSILAFEGDGRVVHVEGDYRDYVRWRERDRAEAATRTAAAAAPDPGEAKPAAPAQQRDPATARLTYAERLELAGLMEQIDAAEAEVSRLEAELASPAFAALDYQEQATFLAQLADARSRAEALVERWGELEARSELP